VATGIRSLPRKNGETPGKHKKNGGGLMSKKTLWRGISVSFFGLCMALQVWSADVTARIRGTVTDPSGAVVPNAELTATNIQTGVAYTAKTQSTGNYELLNLPVGTYTLAATAPAFQTFSASGIKLNIDQLYVQDIRLGVGSTSERVEVTANAVQVDSTNMQLGNLVEAQQIVDLPLIGRNWTQLELLQPGIQASSDRFELSPQTVVRRSNQASSSTARIQTTCH